MAKQLISGSFFPQPELGTGRVREAFRSDVPAVRAWFPSSKPEMLLRQKPAC